MLLTMNHNKWFRVVNLEEEMLDYLSVCVRAYKYSEYSATLSVVDVIIHFLTKHID